MPDVAVLGSGVAGAVIARRLHDFGFEVAVYEQQPIAALRKPEISVAPQFLETLSAAGFPRMVHSLAPRQTESVQLLWGSLTPRSQPHRLWHFERRTFESALRETLAGCGIPMHAAVSGVTAADFGARYLVDATGRRSTRGQPVRLAASLLGISSIWRPLAGPPEIPYLEANDHSWTWASPRSDGAVQVTVFGSPREIRVRGQVDAWYVRTLAASRLSSWTSRASRDSSPTVFNATPYCKIGVCDSDRILVGEAAFTVDPISSQGVQCAVISAVQAAACVNTILRNPASGPMAATFFENRVQEQAQRAATLAASFYQENLPEAVSSFWSERAMSKQEVVPGAPRVKVADSELENLARRPLRVSSQVKFAEGAVLCDNTVERRQVVRHPFLPREVAFLAEFEISRLLQDAMTGGTGLELLKKWQVGSSDRGQQILRWLIERELLVPAEYELNAGSGRLSAIDQE